MFKKINSYINHRFNRFYRRSRIYLIIDVVLIAIVIILGAILLRLYAYQPDISLSPWSNPVHNQEIDLNNPPLDLSFQIDNTNIYLEKGALLTLRLKNNGNDSIKDINLALISESTSFSLSRLEFSNSQKTSLSGMKINGFNLYLDELSPGTDREVNLLVSFQREKATGRTISGRLDSEYKVQNQIIKKSFSLDDLKVASNLSATAASYYNSPQGDQLGTGPFPPISLLPTNLWVYFQADTINNFTNFVMSAKLANNVSFTNNYSLLVGELNYNEDTRQIIWKVGDVGGEDNNNNSAGFEIELIPSEEQVGTYADLLTNIKFNAIDYFTKLPVSGTLGDIDTSLKRDLINKDDGLVVGVDSL